MREKYESLSAAVLKDLAKARGIKGISGMKKSEVVEAMLAQDEIDKKEKEAAEKKAAAKEPQKRSGEGPDDDQKGDYKEELDSGNEAD